MVPNCNTFVCLGLAYSLFYVILVCSGTCYCHEVVRTIFFKMKLVFMAYTTFEDFFFWLFLKGYRLCHFCSAHIDRRNNLSVFE